ncbi:MAG TPA: putative metallopeptidase [Patescibacteria group bacterium]|nr:putative metallopeptidase [Patescibacteria group bacterium]
MPRRKKSVKLEWEEAPEVKEKIVHILQTLDLPHINHEFIYCYRTQGSSSRSYARIWSFPKIFQHALNIEPSYVIEVLSKYFDPLSEEEQIHVLIHELLHIPKNFSGALLPHKSAGRQLEKTAKDLFKQYKQIHKL